ncbi:MAG: CPBP family intramembrane metalloprotease [Ignavibacteria bacterium]|nr:CPBP family intramembrane metalloprotease [Ignavibacteria bacterium]
MKKILDEVYSELKKLDKDIIIVFLATTILNTINHYYTSRRFFRIELSHHFQNSFFLNLYEYLYWFVGDFTVLFILTILLIVFLHKRKLSEFGITIGDYKLGLKITSIVVLIFMPILWFVSSLEGFISTQPHLQLAKSYWNIFLYYEFGMLIYMIGWEFIWRGYMLFGLEKKFGYYAVFIQMIPFVILHFGKPELETFGAIFGAIGLGILALKTRSFIYCVLIHYFIMLSIDLISVIRHRTEVYGISFDSFIELIKRI